MPLGPSLGHLQLLVRLALLRLGAAALLLALRRERLEERAQLVVLERACRVREEEEERGREGSVSARSPLRGEGEQEESDAPSYLTTSSPPLSTSSAGVLSTPNARIASCPTFSSRAA